MTQETASAQGLAYIKPSGAAVMKVDSTSDLAYGAKRDSQVVFTFPRPFSFVLTRSVQPSGVLLSLDNRVRITTEKAYDNGLFILDALKFPYGCAVWPAWWMYVHSSYGRCEGYMK